MRIPRIFGTVAAIAAAATLAACSASPSPAPSDGATAPAAAGVFPVTIEHVYGETVIESQPTRVATIAWANHEVPLALGVVPVGMSKATWGDDDGDGVLPWVEERLEELGAETPALFDETDGIDFEAVADTNPDVILASYSGLTQEEYDTLSKIAPVVAYPEIAWGTSYEDMIRLNSEAIGLSPEGEALIEELHATVATSLAAHPALEGKKLLFSWLDPSDLSQIGFYTGLDTRPGFLASIGLPLPTVVEEESVGTDQFYAQISAEAADRFDDVDVFISYSDAGEEFIKQLQADPLLSQIPAIAAGAVVLLPTGPLAASANPSPLSIGWGIDDYFALLSAPLQ